MKRTIVFYNVTSNKFIEAIEFESDFTSYIHKIIVDRLFYECANGGIFAAHVCAAVYHSDFYSRDCTNPYLDNAYSTIYEMRTDASDFPALDADLKVNGRFIRRMNIAS